MKFFSHTKELLLATYNRLWEFNIGVHGAAIAFYAIFSTAPLIVILVWLVSIVLGEEVGYNRFRQTLDAIIGPDLTKSIEMMIKSTGGEGSAGVWSSVIAIITLIFGATTLLSQLKQSLNLVWGLKNPKIGSVWQFLWDRFTGLLFIGLLSILFLLGLISETVVYGMEYVLSPIFGSENIFLAQITSTGLNIILAFSFFATMFKILPDIRVRFRDIAVGALVTTVLVLIGKSLIDWYLSAPVLQPAYKAAGSFVIFLIWMYYNAQVVLLGAIFTQVFTSRYGGQVRPYWDATLNDDWY